MCGSETSLDVRRRGSRREADHMICNSGPHFANPQFVFNAPHRVEVPRQTSLTDATNLLWCLEVFRMMYRTLMCCALGAVTLLSACGDDVEDLTGTTTTTTTSTNAT